jgi:hypothetical protein
MQISEILSYTNTTDPVEEFVADVEKSTYGLVQTGLYHLLIWSKRGVVQQLIVKMCHVTVWALT